MPARAPRTIAIRGASTHNLQALDVDLPRNALTVISGVSGSGKSSLAFDTLAREGERRYLETFSSHARQLLARLGRAEAASITGLSPTVVVDQRPPGRNPRSTVGTVSGVWDLLRLLFARLGERTDGGGGAPLRRSLFSFSSPEGACPRCRGIGDEDRLDPELLVADAGRTLREGALRITTPMGYLMYSQVTMDVLDQVCRAHGFSVDARWCDLTQEQRGIVLGGSDIIRIPYGKHPLESRLRWKGITPKPRQEGTYKGILPVMEAILAHKRTPSILRFVRSQPCRECGGTRLCAAARAVTVGGRTIAELAALPLDALGELHATLAVAGPRAAVARAILAELGARCRVLSELGLGYLASARETATLSAGEARRLRLAAQVGVGLAGLTVVLDEPSVGLHVRDHDRLLAVLEGVRDAGNTVVVVEHERDAVRRADWVIDIGPGAGRVGGRLLFAGPPAALLARSVSEESGAGDGAPHSRTRAFLTGEEAVPLPAVRRSGNGGRLLLSDARRHNLRNITVEVPLVTLTVITGVSGAGKSSLVEELLARREAGTLEGGELVETVLAIDQSAIGRTPRSNPATYTGLADHLRDLFARQPAARERGLGKGHFSFNVKGGRCEACEGAGVIEIGMHFLGGRALPCEACGGRRFGEDTLAVRYRGHTISDVLALPVAEAHELFADLPRMRAILALLVDLGLGYLPLGQPSTTLSGGEAQRIKLATELARRARGHTLYVLDEPTAGLHPADVALLISSLQRLVDAGHTVLVVEHDLDVVKVADHVIDLGPGSGPHGGAVVAAGTPEAVAASAGSHTGAALRRMLAGAPGGDVPAPVESVGAAAARPVREAGELRPIELRGVSTHNLKGIDVTIPGGSLTVITGISGSGKSSLAFDTIHAEAQRRFADSLSAYVRRHLGPHGEADVASCRGLTPTIALGQRTGSRNPRSTVGTMTEIADLYRLLFARVGVRRCPSCDRPLAQGRCDSCGCAGPPVLLSSAFSPNGEHGACPHCRGLGFVLRCDPERLVVAPDRSLLAGALGGHRFVRHLGDSHGQHVATLQAAGRELGVDLAPPWRDLAAPARELAMGGLPELEVAVDWQFKRGQRSGTHRFRARWLGFPAYVEQEYERTHLDRRGDSMADLMVRALCPACAGRKLRPEMLAVRFAGSDIAALSALAVDDGLALFADIDAYPGQHGVDDRDHLLTTELRAEIVRRLGRLRAAGLGYLSLDREAATLAGGEARRVRLASLLGAGLCNVTYVLDEPTAGLHARDTERLIGLLVGLRDAGNTVIVAEHDRDVILRADHVVDLGPGAGAHGGQVVCAGPPAEVATCERSRTGVYLRDPNAVPLPASRRALRPGIGIRGASRHNLRDLDVDIPIGGLVAITGVSGSGKTTDRKSTRLNSSHH
jgi:excinuclease ABC subunit A